MSTCRRMWRGWDGWQGFGEQGMGLMLFGARMPADSPSRRAGIRGKGKDRSDALSRPYAR